MAVATSLPEVFNGLSATVLVGEPDLTAGDIFGSNVFNLAILAMMDVANPGVPLLSVARTRHLVTAWYGIALALVASAALIISQRVWDMGIGWIGIYTPLLVVLYILFLRGIYQFESSHPDEAPSASPGGSEFAGSLREVYVRFSVAALFVIGAGIALAFVGDRIAEITGWGQGFVGTLFIALTTSLPELSVSFAAVRIGAADMSVGNILGSNMFNMTILALDDIFYTDGPMLADVSSYHAYTGFIFVAMTLVVMLAIRYKVARKTRLGFAWYVPVLLVLFAVSSYISYTF